MTALRAGFDAAPEQFSPNVLLGRSIQDALLPTVAYVAGPSEIAYFAQLRPVYERFGIPMPVVYPRRSATLLDAHRAARCASASLRVDDVLATSGDSARLRRRSSPSSRRSAPLGHAAGARSSASASSSLLESEGSR